MSIRGTLSLLKQELVSRLSGDGGRALVAGSLGNRSEPPRRGTKEFLDSYDTHPWVRGVTGKVAQEVGITRWQAVDLRDPDATPLRHVIIPSLIKPNPYMSGASLMRVTQLCLDLTGHAFWFLSRNALGAPVQFYPVPPHWVAETPYPGSPVFRLRWQSLQATIPESEMIWLNDPSPVHPYARGSGIVRALADEVETDEYAAKHAKNLFFNRAMPDVVVTMEGADEPAVKAMERAWRSRSQGLFKAMAPFFTGSKLEFWQPQSMNLENLTLVPLRKFERDVTLQVIGMPPEQMGIVENSNRATAEASEYIFHSRLIRPRRAFIAAELNTKLCPQYDPNLALRFVDTTPRDKEYDLSIAKAAPWTLDADEWRDLMGKTPIGGEAGKTRAVPLQYFLTTDLADPSQRPVSGSSDNTGAPKQFDPEWNSGAPKNGVS